MVIEGGCWILFGKWTNEWFWMFEKRRCLLSEKSGWKLAALWNMFFEGMETVSMLLALLLLVVSLLINLIKSIIIICTMFHDQCPGPGSIISNGLQQHCWAGTQFSSCAGETERRGGQTPRLLVCKKTIRQKDNKTKRQLDTKTIIKKTTGKKENKNKKERKKYKNTTKKKDKEKDRKEGRENTSFAGRSSSFVQLSF